MRAIRRAQINVAYTQGYRKRPRVAFGPPLSVGTTAEREYFDLLFEQPFSGNLVTMLNNVLPDLLCIHEAAPVFIKSPSLSAIISLLKYRVGPVAVTDEQIKAIMEREEIPIKRQKNGVELDVDIRPFIHAIDKDGDYLDISVRFLPEGSVRIDELLSCFGILPQTEIRKERIALLAERDGIFVDPLNFNTH
jgi:radical SAM-linked protein